MAERQHRPRLAPDEDPARATPSPASKPAARGAPRLDHLDASALADLGRVAGNRAAASLVAQRRSDVNPATEARPSVQRDRGSRGRGGSATAAMSRADFEAEAGRLGVGRVVTGTLDQQASRLNSLSGADHVGDVLRADVAAGRQQWVSWDPGASSTVYRAIIGGLSDFASAMGGLPPIREIVFLKRDYVGVRVAGELRTGWGATAADYQGAAMQVYENAALQATAKVLPTRRDTAGAAAAADQPSQGQGVGRIITHELGHGLQEVAHDPAAAARAAGPLLMDRYARDIGWRRDGSGGAWRLYDVGDPAVQAAFAAGQAPEARFQITRDTWQQGWHEQPISAYQVSSGPFEDFPEAVMAFVSSRAVLRERSPARHDFVQSVITELAGRLGTPATAPAGGSGGGAAAAPVEQAGGGG